MKSSKTFSTIKKKPLSSINESKNFFLEPWLRHNGAKIQKSSKLQKTILTLNLNENSLKTILIIEKFFQSLKLILSPWVSMKAKTVLSLDYVTNSAWIQNLKTPRKPFKRWIQIKLYSNQPKTFSIMKKSLHETKIWFSNIHKTQKRNKYLEKHFD